MGKYSAEAANANAQLASAVGILEGVQQSQSAASQSIGNGDLLSSLISPKLSELSSGVVEAISAINSLKSAISEKARQLDLEEERKRQEAARKLRQGNRVQ